MAIHLRLFGTMVFAITLAHSIGRFTHGLTGRADERSSFVARGRRLARDIKALIGDRDPQGGPGEGALDDIVASSHEQMAAWRARAEDAEARVAELEARLAESECTALELRSRVICLHGKLATTAATLRYQSMTLALDAGGHGGDGEPAA